MRVGVPSILFSHSKSEQFLKQSTILFSALNGIGCHFGCDLDVTFVTVFIQRIYSHTSLCQSFIIDFDYDFILHKSDQKVIFFYPGKNTSCNNYGNFSYLGFSLILPFARCIKSWNLISSSFRMRTFKIWLKNFHIKRILYFFAKAEFEKLSSKAETISFLPAFRHTVIRQCDENVDLLHFL